MTISIRAYDVGFGDCVLVRFPHKDRKGGRTGHMLVDFGRAPGKGGTTKVFPAIAADIEEQCHGHLDVLVMSHEHLDHIEGFYHQRAVFDRMKVDHVWMSLPSHPRYYKDYPDAEVLKKSRKQLREFAAHAAGRGLALAPAFESLVQNNLANADRIDYLRGLVSEVQYLHVGSSSKDTRPFAPGAVTVLAPLEDVSEYYKRSPKGKGLATLTGRRPTGNGLAALSGRGLDALQPADPDDEWSFHQPVHHANRIARPINLTATDWLRLREGLQAGVEAVHQIDRAANNTSLCFLLELAGLKLLFPGDAELESWEHFGSNKKLKDGIDFLKLSHHGSHNGTPTELLDSLLPRKRKGSAVVLVSTKRDVYGIQNPVPDDDLLTDLRGRATVYSTEDAGPRGWVDIELPGRGARHVRRSAPPPPPAPGAGGPALASEDPDDSVSRGAGESRAKGDPFILARRRRLPPVKLPKGSKPLDSGEHVWVGLRGAQQACRAMKVAPRMFESIPRLHTPDSLSYGELVALSGDFYGDPESLFSEEEALLPWLWEPNDLSDLRDIFRAELDWIDGDHDKPFPDFNRRMAWNAKSYIELAVKNTDHFGWHNMRAYSVNHALALDMARKAQGRDDEMWARARFYNAYADHFLTDGFAAGHIRIPRLQIMEWARKKGYSDKLAGGLSKVLHDHDGHVNALHATAHHKVTDDDGLHVTNANGDDWHTRCDGQLFLGRRGADPKAPAVVPIISAVAASVTELIAAWKGASSPRIYEATKYVAFPHPTEIPLAEKFSPAKWKGLRLDNLVASVDWFSKVPWIGPGLRKHHLEELFAALPDLMTRFRAAIKKEQGSDAFACVAKAYIEAYRDLR